MADWLGANYKVIAKSIKELGLEEADDSVLFAAGRRFGNIVVVTKDEDFVELVERLGAPPQVLWLTTGNTTTVQLQLILRQAFPVALERLIAGAPVVEITR